MLCMMDLQIDTLCEEFCIFIRHIAASIQKGATFKPTICFCPCALSQFVRGSMVDGCGLAFGLIKNSHGVLSSSGGILA